MALAAARLNAEVILVATVSVAIWVHDLLLSPPPYPFSLSLIRLTVSVGVTEAPCLTFATLEATLDCTDQCFKV